MPLTLVETDAFPTTVQAPAATEPASAPSLVSQYLQPVANRLRWLFNRVNVFVVGGELDPAGNVSIFTPTTKSVAINGLNCSSSADGGAVHVYQSGGLQVDAGGATIHGGLTMASGPLIALGVSVTGTVSATGAVSAPKQVVQGRITAGTTVYASNSTQYIYNNSAAASGVIWKLADTPALGPDGSGALITVFNSSATAIAVQDPAGTVLVNISSSSKRALLYCNGTAWSVIDFS